MSDRQKELKLSYKLNPPPMGVYQIKNQKNGKIFISSSLNLPAMKNRLQFLLDLKTNPNQLNLESHPNMALRSDWNIYGAESFCFEILETIDTEKIPENERRQAVATLEEKWLGKLQPYGTKGYNKAKERVTPPGAS
ncbi:MAG: GIY-YIG nuclease family protein [Pelosinus sp.]|nr:GIY-YIG nuclease family protein [Pelosinus sp.]